MTSINYVRQQGYYCMTAVVRLVPINWQKIIQYLLARCTGTHAVYFIFWGKCYGRKWYVYHIVDPNLGKPEDPGLRGCIGYDSGSQMWWDLLVIEGTGIQIYIPIGSYCDLICPGRGSVRFKVNIEIGIDTNNTSAAHLFELYQNRPNPFITSTKIGFRIERNNPVSLEVFDTMGKKVSTLLNNTQMSPGEYYFTLDGNGLAGGIYFYRLKVGNQMMMKRMSLLK